MPVIPNIIERAAIAAGLLPPPLVDVVNTAALRAFGVAQRLQLFELLGSGAATAADLAARCDADTVSLEHLLDFLARAGYLRRDGERFRNSRAVERWVLGGGRALPDFIEHWHNVLFEHFSTLEDAVRAGQPRPHLHEWLSASGHWPVFNAAMAQLAGQTADAVARAAALPATVRTLADVGGSHGLNAAAFCRRHPLLRATIIDLPEAVGTANAHGPVAALAERVSLRTADITRDELGGPYDVVLLFQLLHYFPAERNAELLARVHDALTPGGRVVIFDQLAGTAPTPLAAAFFSLLALTYRVGLGGDLYRYDDFAGWLGDAGFRDVRKRRILTAPGNFLVMASR